MLETQNLFSSLQNFSPRNVINHLKEYASVGGYSFLRKAPAVIPLAEVKQGDTAELQFKRMIDLDIKSNEEHTALKSKKYSGGKIKSSELSLNNSEYSPASTAHPTNPMTEEANKAYAAFSGIQKYCAKLRALTGVKSAGLDTQLDYGSKRKDITDEANRKQKVTKVTKKIENLIKKFNSQLPEGITPLSTDDFKGDINAFEEKLFSTLCAVPAYDGKPLTVEKEVGIFLDIGYTKMFEDSNSVFKRALQQKAETEKAGGTYTMPVIDARSWAGSDADGNVNVTPQKTSETILSNKKKAAELYNNDFEEFFPPHQHISPEMKEIRGNLEKLRGSLDDESGRDDLIADTQGKIKAFLEAEAAKSKDVASPAKVLLEKYEQFKLTGPKADIRQSSVQNNEFLYKIYKDVLKDNLPEINEADIVRSESGDHLKSGSDAHKAVIAALADPVLKAKVKASFEANKDKPEWKELNRIIVAVTNPNSVDRYRISDARNIEDIAALRGLEALAQEITGQEVKPKINFIPLAETEEDIKRLTETLPQMVERGLCLKDKDGNPEITMFVGYSDAEKRMGLTGLTTIVETVGEVDKKLKEVGEKLGVKVKLKLSHGGGEDVMRGARAKQADKTEQGTSGVRIGTGTNFKEALRNNANDGNAIDGLLAAGREIANLKKKEPALAKLSGLDTLAGRVRFRSIMSMSDKKEAVESLSQDIPNEAPQKAEVARGTGDLLSILLHPSRLISKLANVSSRAGSKGASGGGALATNKTFDLDSERAIGMGSIFPISGARLQALMGLPTLEEIKKNETASGKKSSELFAKSVVQQDIVYKGLLEASLTDFDTLYDQYPDIKKKSSAELIQNPVKEDYEAVTKEFKEALGKDDKAAMTAAMQKFVDMMHTATLQTTMGLFYKLGGDIAVAKFKEQFSEPNKTGEMSIARATRKTIKAGFVNFQKSYPKNVEGQEILRDICDKSKLSEPDRAHLAQLIRENKEQIRTDITKIDANTRGYMASVVRKLQDVPHSLELLSAKPVSVGA